MDPEIKKLRKLVTDNSSGLSSSHNEQSRYLHSGKSCFPKSLSPFCTTAKRPCLRFFDFSVAVFENYYVICHIYGCYSRTLSLFLLRGFQRPTHSIPVPFSMFMFRIWKSFFVIEDQPMSLILCSWQCEQVYVQLP